MAKEDKKDMRALSSRQKTEEDFFEPQNTLRQKVVVDSHDYRNQDATQV